MTAPEGSEAPDLDPEFLPDEPLDEDAPAFRPEELGEAAECESACHGDFHNRPGQNEEGLE